VDATAARRVLMDEKTARPKKKFFWITEGVLSTRRCF
jgi:hypothetical protein